MITICPQCQLPLAVTAADLRVAQGQVRCGRCAAVFNALSSLYEPGGPSPERRAAGAAPGSASQGMVPPPPSAAPGFAALQRPGQPAAHFQPEPAAGGRTLVLPDGPLDLDLSPPPGADVESTGVLDARPLATQSGTSGLFRAPPRDDEPRFDDTHGADDWPAEADEADAAGATSAASADAGRREDVGSDAPAHGDSDDGDGDDGDGDGDGDDRLAEAGLESAAEAAGDDLPDEPRLPPPVAETTDTFVRAEVEAQDEPDLASPAPAPLQTPAPAPGAAAADVEATPDVERDWSIDTMTAAELAALVARAEGDEPPELASIRIAVDDASEITVLPSEAPAVATARVPDAGARVGEGAARGALADAEADRAPAASDFDAADGGERSFPRLAQARDDDPDFAGARREAAERRAALPRGSALRWLELEPAQPAAMPLPPLAAPDAMGAPDTVAPAPEVPSDREGRAPEDFDARPSPVAPPATVTEGTRPGALAAALGLDQDLNAVDPVPPSADAVAEELAAAGAPRAARAPRWMWAATVLLALALAAQLAHLYRDELAGVPALREPLTRLYAALGRPLQPDWQLDRYELRQQGVVAEPVSAGTLTVRASIRNGAARAQPAPLLRVTLQDRFGNRIATRDLTPREYGGAAAIAPAPMLAPGQRIDAEVSLLDPGGEAVGFELDVCLRRADASVTCANDAPVANG